MLIHRQDFHQQYGMPGKQIGLGKMLPKVQEQEQNLHLDKLIFHLVAMMGVQMVELMKL